ncbi:hypothetical protein D1007_06488 [Hordeum vulgare]|nr:hypothetical protein D1007_06488 [Hordeum vulgare]
MEQTSNIIHELKRNFTSNVPGNAGDGSFRPGGSFWVLADSDDEEDTLATDGEFSLSASPTPSDRICKVFQDGFLEEEVAEIVDELVPTNDPARQGLQDVDMIEVARRVSLSKNVGVVYAAMAGSPS